MTFRPLLPMLALLTVSVSAMAQESGGLRLGPGINGGPVGLARPLPFTRPPFLTARDVQGGMTPADHQAQNQAMISKLRGDAGFLAGFSLGTPLAASRQTPALPDDAGYSYRRHHRHGDGPIIINNDGPLAVTVGNGNVVQQQSAMGGGPAAQQQVVTMPGVQSGPGGVLNLVSSSGNIIQRLAIPSFCDCNSGWKNACTGHGLCEFLHQWREPVFRHVWDQFVEHAALPEQRVRPRLAGIRFQ